MLTWREHEWPIKTGIHSRNGNNSMDSHLGLKSLRIAVPYIRAYKGRIFVVKLGGGLCRPGPTLTNLADQIAVLHQLGIGVVLVHGGGEQATALGRRLGIAPEIVAGRRITNADTLEVVKMAFAGTVNADLLAAFRRAKVPAIGLSGIDAALVTRPSPARAGDHRSLDRRRRRRWISASSATWIA